MRAGPKKIPRGWRKLRSGVSIRGDEDKFFNFSFHRWEWWPLSGTKTHNNGSIFIRRIKP